MTTHDQQPIIFGLFEAHCHILKWQLRPAVPSMELELSLRTEDGIVCLDAVVLKEDIDQYHRAFSEAFLRVALALSAHEYPTTPEAYLRDGFNDHPGLDKLHPGGLEAAIVEHPQREPTEPVVEVKTQSPKEDLGDPLETTFWQPQ